VRTEQAASLVSLSSEPLPHVISANPVVAPPTADALNSSADLYYEVDNRVLQLRPGQRIGVEIPLSNTETSLVVPSGAILYDIYGNTWLYIETGVRQYTRRRVAVRFIDGADAVLSNGPVAGTRVVVDGAAELFGTEFGAGK
jgi:multidrug efflux pump subunit AcrA (membrane-fusion protein)